MSEEKAMEKEMCNICGNPMMKVSTMYKEKLFGKEREICEVAAKMCTSCDNLVIDPRTKEYIQHKKQTLAIEIITNKDAVPLLISNIKELRLNKKLNQRQIGDALGVTEQRYGAIERNTNTPTVLTALQIAYIMGEEANALYELIYISKSFYERLKDLELIETENGYKFDIAQDVKEARQNLYKLRGQLKKLNEEKRTQRYRFENDEITKEEYIAIVDTIEEKKEKIKEIKDHKTTGMEKTVKKMISNRDFVIKQNNVVDVLDWRKIQITYKDELDLLFY